MVFMKKQIHRFLPLLIVSNITNKKKSLFSLTEDIARTTEFLTENKIPVQKSFHFFSKIV